MEPPVFFVSPSAGRRRPAAGFLGLFVLAVIVGSLLVGNPEQSVAQDLPPGGTFLDEDLSVHEGYIEAIAARGVTLGCAYERFCPTDTVSRAQMASFLARALGLGEPASDHFTDDNGNPHEANINKIAEAGITLGCGGTAYCPEGTVSRDQMASFLARAFGLGEPASDHFTDDNGNPHEANINKIAEAGITLGCGGTAYCPEGRVSRDQMASFLGRALGLTELTPPHPVRTLVDQFYQWEPGRNDIIDRYEVDDVYYLPRQFESGMFVGDNPDDLVTNAGRYAGWDVLLPASSWSNRSDSQFFNFHLTRPATVALVWRERWDATPSWLSSWSLAGTVAIDGNVLNVYEKELGYGWHSLAGPTPDGEGSRVYTILVAESDGDPTVAPPVPAGAETPVPNELCPLWVHDAYTTIGWDGDAYGTWHPQIDPTYWCSFGHEHGSDPRLIPGAPFVGYQYVADKVPQHEPDMGFKETIFRTPAGLYVRFIDHVSTASVRRVCARLHTVYAMVYDASGSELFRAGFKADFGVSEATDRDGNPLITPNNCGYDMGELAATVDPNRFRKAIRTTADSNDYERWRSSQTVQTSNLGMVFNHEFDIRDPFTFCADLTCDSVRLHDITRAQTSTKREMDNTRHGDPFVFDSRLALGSGIFYTDPYGDALVDPSAANATEQYVSPGFYLNLGDLPDPDHCAAIDPWTMLYSCANPGLGHVNISHSLDPSGWMAQVASG